MVCLKQAVSAHCMDFSVWTFYKASACSVSITFSRATSEGGELCVAKVLTGEACSSAKQLSWAASQPQGTWAKLHTRLMLQFAVTCVGRLTWNVSIYLLSCNLWATNGWVLEGNNRFQPKLCHSASGGWDWWKNQLPLRRVYGFIEVTASPLGKWQQHHGACAADQSSFGLRSDGLNMKGKGLMKKWSVKYTEIVKASVFIYFVPVQFTGEKGRICLLNSFLWLINSIHLRIEQLPLECLLLLAWKSVRVWPRNDVLVETPCSVSNLCNF